jgi:hypothetical protein
MYKLVNVMSHAYLWNLKFIKKNIAGVNTLPKSHQQGEHTLATHKKPLTSWIEIWGTKVKHETHYMDVIVIPITHYNV